MWDDYHNWKSDQGKEIVSLATTKKGEFNTYIMWLFDKRSGKRLQVTSYKWRLAYTFCFSWIQAAIWLQVIILQQYLHCTGVLSVPAKQRMYEQRVREVEMSSFTSLVFSTFWRYGWGSYYCLPAISLFAIVTSHLVLWWLDLDALLVFRFWDQLSLVCEEHAVSPRKPCDCRSTWPCSFWGSGAAFSLIF